MRGSLGRWWSAPVAASVPRTVPCVIRYRTALAVNPLNTHSAPVRRADQRAVRKSNLSLVARRIAEAGALSRAQLAKLTGLNKTTVSSLVAELIERGVVTESGLADGGGVGRPAQILELDDSRIAALGPRDQRRLRRRLRVRPARCRALPDGRRARQPQELAGARLRAARGARGRGAGECDSLGLTPIGAGISVPGTVEAETGTLIHAPNLGWDQLPVVECLREALGDPGVRLRVGNDANLAALGELESGALRGIRHGLLIYGNVGIGGAVIVDGAIFPGSGGFAGEIGHIPVRPFDGERCRCGGRGCLETLAGQEAIACRVGIQGTRSETSSPADARRRAARAAAIPDAHRGARRGRRVPRHLHRRGGLARQPAAGRARRRARARSRPGSCRVRAPRWPSARRSRRRIVEIVGSELGDESAIRGGAALVLHRRAERSDLRPGARLGALTALRRPKPPD